METNRGWPMRVFGWTVLGLVLPGWALAAPVPPPPADYPGAQYIDSTGCVFLRDGQAWSPRLDRQGAPICGFPPSQAAIASPSVPPPSPEEVLAAAMAEGLRSGDLLTDTPRKPLAEVPPDPAQARLDATLADQLVLDTRLRSAMAGRAPDGLCARLGYRPAENAAPGSVDVTQGLCPDMTATSPAPRLVSGAAAPETVPAPVGSLGTVRKPTLVVPNLRPVPATRPSVVARRPATPPAKAPSIEMIPAGARYVQIGVYGNEANALSALRRLSGMGYRTAQRHEKHDGAAKKAILAGPFPDRQGLVSALTRLRTNGYPGAVAR